MGAVPAEQYTGYDQEAAIRRETLVLEHIPQVRLIARRIHSRLPSYISLDDLISTGVLGLLDAIDHFDPALNIQLKTYAERRIRGAIMDSLREMDWAPRDLRQKAKAIEAAIHRAKQRLGTEPEAEDIAAEMKLAPEQYIQLLSSVQAIDLEPLECVSRNGEESTLLRIVSDDPEQWPSRVVERRELQRVIALAIDRMPATERTVLNLYYFEEMTLDEIGQIIGMHLSRVGQLRAQAVLRLRSHLQRVWPAAGGKV